MGKLESHGASSKHSQVAPRKSNCIGLITNTVLWWTVLKNYIYSTTYKSEAYQNACLCAYDLNSSMVLDGTTEEGRLFQNAIVLEKKKIGTSL